MLTNWKYIYSFFNVLLDRHPPQHYEQTMCQLTTYSIVARPEQGCSYQLGNAEGEGYVDVKTVVV